MESTHHSAEGDLADDIHIMQAAGQVNSNFAASKHSFKNSEDYLQIDMEYTRLI